MTDRSLDMLIDEVVLGLASDEDRRRLRALAAQDADVASRLEQARQRFAPLDDTATPLPLPEGLWDRIAARLDKADAPAPAAEVIDLAQVRARLGQWRRAALGAVAACLVMAVALGWSLLSVAEPLVVAVLLNSEGQAVALIESGEDNRTQVTLLERPDLPADRVMQVWTKPDADGPPVSLGLLAGGGSRTLTIRGLPAPGASQLYEITSEPAGGSPTDLPTGPILGVGLAKKPVI